jgi:mannitol-1-/sugar-/sorbitol-6-phosphatase
MPLLTASAVLLDMDGTLVNSDAVVERTWRRWAARYGLDGAYVYGISHGRQGHDTMAELLPGRSREQNLAEARELAAAEAADVDGVIPVPGASWFLAALAGVPHALVTSATDAIARARMAAVGLPMPPVTVTADQVSAGKPAPEGFLKAAATLGVDPADCVAFEDSAAGLAAARAAGMRTIGVGPRALAHQPELHVQDFNDLRLETAPDGAVRISVPRTSLDSEVV